MSTKKKSPAPRSPDVASAAGTRVSTARRPAAAVNSSWLSERAVRETIESVVVAFILAFLFRTFAAEPFVIPTGSMAPTLMGAHKDVTCPQCGFQYAAGASGEEEQMAEQMGRARPGIPVEKACCPMCRYFADVGPGSGQPTYGGDRIVVSKFAYEFGEPHRWDVVVFKNPSEAQTNFIKRCVGLPEETIRIFHGDLFVQPNGAKAFERPERKSNELQAMAQIVYDNDYVLDSMTEAGWPLRWQELNANSAAWKSDDGGRSFATTGSATKSAGSAPQSADTNWLRYRHYVPSIDDWQSLDRGRLPAGRQVRPLLVTDFYAYNTSVDRGRSAADPRMLGMHWVGDLMLDCELESTDGKGTAILDLVKGGKHFRCALNMETGEAELSIDGLADFHPKAQTTIRGAGRHQVMFANFDQQLRLWVNGTAVAFDDANDGVNYPKLENDLPRTSADDPLDLAPAGVGSQGAGLAVRHLKLWRDLYYVAARGLFGPLADYDGNHTIASLNYAQLYSFWSDPDQWYLGDGVSPFAQRRQVSFPLAADQFFMLGDNSPASSDARLWNGEKFVARELLIGQALFIFWPHSFHQIPGTSIPFPFFPNFARMGLIR
jgi:signal peptidase I